LQALHHKDNSLREDIGLFFKGAGGFEDLLRQALSQAFPFRDADATGPVFGEGFVHSGCAGEDLATVLADHFGQEVDAENHL